MFELLLFGEEGVNVLVEEGVEDGAETLGEEEGLYGVRTELPLFELTLPRSKPPRVLEFGFPKIELRLEEGVTPLLLFEPELLRLPPISKRLS